MNGQTFSKELYRCDNNREVFVEMMWGSYLIRWFFYHENLNLIELYLWSNGSIDYINNVWDLKYLFWMVNDPYSCEIIVSHRFEDFEITKAECSVWEFVLTAVSMTGSDKNFFQSWIDKLKNFFN